MPVSETHPAIDRLLDLRGTPCPINFVKTKLALEKMEPGQVLEVIIDLGEPSRNVPRSVQEDGHVILLTEETGGVCRLLIRKRS